VLTIASTGTAGDLDSVIDGIINDSATISGDDAFSMSGLFAYGFTHDDDDSYAGGDQSGHLTFEGHSGGWNYMFNYVVGENGYYDSNGADAFRDYAVYKELDNGLSYGFGNVRGIFLKANSVAEADTLQLNNTATGGALEARGEQIGLKYEADQFRVMARLYDGNDDFAMDARVEFLAMGSWDNCNCFGSMAGSESTLLLGFSNSDEDRFDGTSFDVTYKTGALAVHAAMTDISDSEGLGGDNAWESTTVQASYFFADDTMAYVSYEDIDGGDDDLDIGINHYFSDSCKGTLEIDFENDGFDPTNPATNDDMVIAGQIQFTF
jgi:hypothetical protein